MSPGVSATFIITVVILLFGTNIGGSRTGRQKECTDSSGGSLPLGELMVNTEQLNSFNCRHWKLEGLAGTPCDPASLSTKPSFLRVEFWRGVGNFSPTLYDAPGTEIENVFVILSRKPVEASMLQGSSISNGPVYSFTPPLKQYDVFIDADAVVNNRPYHSVLAPSRYEKMDRGDDWYINVMNLQAGEMVPTVQAFAVNVTCMPSNITEQPCPRAAPAARDVCNGKGKCVQQKGDVPDGWPSPTTCSCADGWGDFACNRNLTLLTDNQTAEVLPLSWNYWTLKFEGTDINNSQLLVQMVRDASVPGMPLLCLKPMLPSDDDPGTTDLPNRNYVNMSHCDVTSYSLVQNQHFLMLTYDAVKYNKYYISVWNLNNEAKAVVKLTAHWVDLKGPSKGAFMCPFGCWERGECSDTAPEEVPVMKPRSQTPFNCNCKSGYGGVMCEGSLSPIHITNSSTRSVSVKPSNLAPGEWHYYPVYVNPARFGGKAQDVIQGLWQVSAAQGIERSSLVMFTYNQYPRLVLDPSNPTMEDELRKGPVFLPPSVPGARANAEFKLQVLPSSVSAFISSGGMIAMLAINNRDFLSTHDVTYTLQLTAARNVASLPQPYMDIILGVAAFLMLVLVLTLCKRIVATQLARRFGRRIGGRDVGGVGMGRAKGVPTSISSNFPTYAWPRKQQETKEGSSSRQAPLPLSTETSLPGAVMSDSPPVTAQASPVAHRMPDPGTSTSTSAGPPAAVLGDVEMGPMTPTVDQDNDQTPDDCCAICLCEYEVGEILRQLPCHHDFHSDCVNKWMTEHDTCPICRMLLVPNPDDPTPTNNNRSDFIPTAPIQPGSAASATTTTRQHLLTQADSSGWVTSDSMTQPPPPPPPAASGHWARSMARLRSLAPAAAVSTRWLGVMQWFRSPMPHPGSGSRQLRSHQALMSQDVTMTTLQSGDGTGDSTVEAITTPSAWNPSAMPSSTNAFMPHASSTQHSTHAFIQHQSPTQNGVDAGAAPASDASMAHASPIKNGTVAGAAPASTDTAANLTSTVPESAQGPMTAHPSQTSHDSSALPWMRERPQADSTSLSSSAPLQPTAAVAADGAPAPAASATPPPSSSVSHTAVPQQAAGLRVGALPPHLHQQHGEHAAVQREDESLLRGSAVADSSAWLGRALATATVTDATATVTDATATVTDATATVTGATATVTDATATVTDATTSVTHATATVTHAAAADGVGMGDTAQHVPAEGVAGEGTAADGQHGSSTDVQASTKTQ